MNKQNQKIKKQLISAVNELNIPSAEKVLEKAAERQEPEEIVRRKSRRTHTWFSVSAAALACAAAVCAILLLPIKEVPHYKAPTDLPQTSASEEHPTAEEHPSETTVPPQETEQKTYYISFDVNPGIELMIDDDGRVEYVKAVNEEAKKLLEGIELEGKTAKEASAVIVDLLISSGYIDPIVKTNTMLISGLNNDDLLTDITNAVTEELGNNNAKTFVIEQKITDEASVREIAEKYEITLGKAQYILNLSLEDENADIENLVSEDLTFIFSSWNTVVDTLEAGEYDEYGQLVLYPIGTLEHRNPALVWARFTAEQRAELKKMYTDDELAILFAPASKVFTMPNFKGMTVAQIRSLAAERGFVARIVYSDVSRPGGIDPNDSPEGTCYAQDPVAGRRMPTSASVDVFVRRTSPLEKLPGFWEMTESSIRSAVAKVQKSADVTLKVIYADYSEKHSYMRVFDGRCYYEDYDVVYGNNSVSYIITVGIQRYPSGSNPIPDPGELPDPEEPLPDPEEPLPDPEEPLPDPEEPLPDPEEPLPDPEEPLPDPEEIITEHSDGDFTETP